MSPTPDDTSPPPDLRSGRRPYGKGAVVRRFVGGRWRYQAVKNQMVKQPDGSTKRKATTALGDTPEEALLNLARKEGQAQSATHTPRKDYDRRPPHKKWTLDELFTIWENQRGEDATSWNTKQKNRRRYELHISPHLGTKTASELTREDFTHLFGTTLPAKKNKNGERLLSSGGIKDIVKVAVMLLRYGHSIKVWDTYLLDGWTQPKRQKQETPNDTRNANLAIWLLAKMREDNHPDWARFQLQLLGLRGGERLGIARGKTGNIHITGKNPRLTVDRQLRYEYRLGNRVVHRLKTDSSWREIPLTGVFLDAIKTQLALLDTYEAQGNFNPLPQFQNQIFLRPDGALITMNEDNKDWHEVLQTYLKDNYEEMYWRRHLNRRATATILARLDPPLPIKTVQAILGHSSSVMSLYYTALERKPMTDAMKRYGETLGKKKSPA